MSGMAEYEIRVTTRRNHPTMMSLVDAVADELERQGLIDTEYEVIVHGPPELSIVAVDRHDRR